MMRGATYDPGNGGEDRELLLVAVLRHRDAAATIDLVSSVRASLTRGRIDEPVEAAERPGHYYPGRVGTGRVTPTEVGAWTGVTGVERYRERHEAVPRHGLPLVRVDLAVRRGPWAVQVQGVFRDRPFLDRVQQTRQLARGVLADLDADHDDLLGRRTG